MQNFSKINECELEKILLKYEPLIQNLAKYHKVATLDKEDVEQELRLVLIDCVKKFNSDKGIQFKTYFTRAALNKINKLRRQHRKNLSLNTTMKNGVEFIEMLSDSNDDFNIIKEEVIEFLYSLPYGYETVRHLMYGETQVSLAKKAGITKGWLNKKIKDNIKAVKNKFGR